MKLVKIRHTENDQEYLFRTPIDLQCGTHVLVNTRRGNNQFGIVSADSIEVPDSVVDYIVPCFQPQAPLRVVQSAGHLITLTPTEA